MMKTKADGIENAFEPYSQKQIDIILSLVPNMTNTTNLAKSLGRTFNAIGMIYKITYSGKLLKNNLENMGDTQDNVYTKVANAKKKIRHLHWIRTVLDSFAQALCCDLLLRSYGCSQFAQSESPKRGASPSFLFFPLSC